MEQWLRQQPEPQRSEPSQAERNADAELLRTLAVYNDLTKQVLESQRICKRPHVRQRAIALGLNVDDDGMMAPPPAVRVTGHGPAPVDEARASTVKVNAVIYRAQDQLARLEAVAKLEKVDLDTVIFALGSRIGALESRIEYLETQLEQLTTKQQRKAKT
jgi:hypothetical protein